MAAADKEPPGWLTLALSVGLYTLRDRTARRRLMFYLTLGAMVQLALGLLILNQLSKSLLFFALYWGFCLLLVCLMILLSLYDMLSMKREQLEKLSHIRESILSDDQAHKSTHADDSEKPGKT